MPTFNSFQPDFSILTNLPDARTKKTPFYEVWVQSLLRIFPPYRIFSSLKSGHIMMYFHPGLNMEPAN